MTIDFYTNLPPIHHLVDITDSHNFTPVPEDWYVVVTDIKGSTKAIENGRYKDVNLLTASTIVGILNIAKGIEIPFIFGGDGASLLIPPRLQEATKISLISTKNLAKKVFNFDLRAGLIPVKIITKDFPILIAKLVISPFYSQAILRGGGISYAEKIIKQTDEFSLNQSNNQDIPGDYSGLECRWQDIKSPRGETLSIIVQTRINQSDELYREIINNIITICGGEDYLRPVNTDRLKLSFSFKQLMGEAKIFKVNFYHRLLYLCFIWLVNLLGFILIKLKIKTKSADWSKYPNIVVGTTDYKKFDDNLRMVIACTKIQRQELEDYLNRKYQAKELYFGIHISDRALMTCLVFERSGRQVHFIDGANGGYALAAKQIKAQIKQDTQVL